MLSLIKTHLINELCILDYPKHIYELNQQFIWIWNFHFYSYSHLYYTFSLYLDITIPTCSFFLQMTANNTRTHHSQFSLGFYTTSIVLSGYFWVYQLESFLNFLIFLLYHYNLQYLSAFIVARFHIYFEDHFYIYQLMHSFKFDVLPFQITFAVSYSSFSYNHPLLSSIINPSKHY